MRIDSRIESVYLRKASLSFVLAILHDHIQNFMHLCNPNTFLSYTSSPFLLHAVNYFRGNEFLMIVVRSCLINSRGKLFFSQHIQYPSSYRISTYIYSDILDEESMLTFIASVHFLAVH